MVSRCIRRKYQTGFPLQKKSCALSCEHVLAERFWWKQFPSLWLDYLHKCVSLWELISDSFCTGDIHCWFFFFFSWFVWLFACLSLAKCVLLCFRVSSPFITLNSVFSVCRQLPSAFLVLIWNRNHLTWSPLYLWIWPVYSFIWGWDWCNGM